jgi:hypothetical protein
MANRWTNEENQIFVDIMPEYRLAMEKQSIQSIKHITEQYVTDLHPLLNGRSRQAVYEHLTYFDDLLEGIGTAENYGGKDGVYFGKLKSGIRQTPHPLRVMRNRSYYLEPNIEKGAIEMVWVNIDIPLKSCTIHAELHCIFVEKKKDTPYKGIELLKRDGGWISFVDSEEANRYCQDQYPGYKLIVHC